MARWGLGVFLIVLLALLSVVFSPSATTAQTPVAKAPTSWRTFRGSYQRAGQSDRAGITHRPALILSRTFPETSGPDTAGIVAGTNRDVYLGVRGAMYRLDTRTAQTLWSATGLRGATPTVLDDGAYLFGSENRFRKHHYEGALVWTTSPLNPNFATGGAAAVGADGTIYYSHDGLWAFSANGQTRWFREPTNWAGSAVSLRRDGTILSYMGNQWVAWNPAGGALWAFDLLQESGNFAVIGADDSYYFTGSRYEYTNPTVFAFNPDRTEKWVFTENMGAQGVSVGSDGRVYASTRRALAGSGGGWAGSLVALDNAGEVRWRREFRRGGLTSEETTVSLPVIDRAGNLMVGVGDGKFYGFAPDGTELWSVDFGTYQTPEQMTYAYNFPVEPLLLEDGVMWLHVPGKGLYVFADPTLISVATGIPGPMVKYARGDNRVVTDTFGIGSSGVALPLTIRVEPPVPWLDVQSAGTTPAMMNFVYAPSQLEGAAGTTTVTITVDDPEGVYQQYEVPVRLVRGSELFLPAIMERR